MIELRLSSTGYVLKPPYMIDIWIYVSNEARHSGLIQGIHDPNNNDSFGWYAQARQNKQYSAEHYENGETMLIMRVPHVRITITLPYSTLTQLMDIYESPEKNKSSVDVGGYALTSYYHYLCPSGGMPLSASPELASPRPFFFLSPSGALAAPPRPSFLMKRTRKL